jgi:hypothetical protein
VCNARACSLSTGVYCRSLFETNPSNHVVKGMKFRVSFGLIDKDLQIQAFEKQLLPRKTMWRDIPFRIWLVYEDNGQQVRESDFGLRRLTLLGKDTIAMLSSGIRAHMKDGVVSSTILSLDTLSGSTTPKHRKFAFKLVCEHEKLAPLADMHCTTDPFYVVSKYPKPISKGVIADHKEQFLANLVSQSAVP